MNLRNWSKGHTIGLIIGMLTPAIFIPIIIGLYAMIGNFYFQQLWYSFMNDSANTGKFISLAIIGNLIWFYLFLNREKYPYAMGVILGSIVYLPYILYVNFK